MKIIHLLSFKFLTLFTLLAPALHGEEILDYIVAVVNEEVIVNTTLREEMELFREQLTYQKIKVPPEKELEKLVLERLIMEELQLQLAKRNGIIIDDTLLNQTLRDIARRNQKTLKEFIDQLEGDGIPFVKFREDMREKIAINQLQQRYVVSRINVSEQEIKSFITNQVQQEDSVNREYRLLHILIATPEAPSPEEIEAQQQKAEDILRQLKNGANFQAMAVRYSAGGAAAQGGDLGWRKAGAIPPLFIEAVSTMEVGELAGPFKNTSGFHIIKLAEKKGEKKSIITQTRARHILLKTRENRDEQQMIRALKNIKQRIEATGEDFAKLAKAISEDTLTASKGGDMDWLSPGDIEPEIEQVMNQLEINQISAPFKSRHGWHILQVLERRERDNTVQALRAEATKQIRQRKIDEELQSWLRQLKDAAYIDYRLDRTPELKADEANDIRS